MEVEEVGEVEMEMEMEEREREVGWEGRYGDGSGWWVGEVEMETEMEEREREVGWEMEDWDMTWGMVLFLMDSK